MFDVGPSEFLLVAVVALIVIGPKDLPKAMRVIGYWVGRMRGVARQFRAGFDNMVREAELEEMEKRWASENERIMWEHGVGGASGSSEPDPAHDAALAGGVAQATPPDDAGPQKGEHDPFAVEPDDHDVSTAPMFVEKPEIRPARDADPSDGVAQPIQPTFIASKTGSAEADPAGAPRNDAAQS